MAGTIEETIRNGLETVDAFDWYSQVLVCIGR